MNDKDICPCCCGYLITGDIEYQDGLIVITSHCEDCGARVIRSYSDEPLVERIEP